MRRTYRTDKETTSALMMAGLFAAVAIGATVGFNLPKPVKTYALSFYSATGDEYVIDRGLSFSDCVGLWPAFPSVTVSCDPEFNH